MAKQSAYAMKLQRINEAYIDAAERTMKQYMLDTMMITMHREFGWGPARLQRLAERWGKIYSDHYQAVNAENPEADYLRDQLDKALEAAYQGQIELEPFEARYGDLKKVAYGGRK